MNFLIKWRIMRLSKPCLRQYSGKEVIVWPKDMYQSYGNLPYLLDIKVDKHLFRALAQFWNPTYSSFTFEGGDLVPIVEEYMALLHCSKIQADRVYSRAINVPNFLKKLINITGMSEQWFAAWINVYGLVIFPKALGHVDEVVTDLLD
ncbi:hypothetical protein Goshw_026259 [Gossypium schwendimanii]|uniref:DUF7745 domain-containing protein n=1 Tax=Gossypium schwendimanii TaxID=34291 RepID=A0A7J9N9S5_GOSSC|nr:hypothetical protein [Gossypium schwendimanii]